MALLSRSAWRTWWRLEGGPGFPHQEARAVFGDLRGSVIHSLYVPNGRDPDAAHYPYKLAWLAALREVVAADTRPPSCSAT